MSRIVYNSTLPVDGAPEMITIKCEPHSDYSQATGIDSSENRALTQIKEEYESVFACKLCYMAFDQTDELTMHMTECHALDGHDRPGPKRIAGIEQISSNSGALELEKVESRTVSPDQQKKVNFARSSIDKSIDQSIPTLDHPSEASFVCEQCGLVFESRKLFADHSCRTQKFACDQCNNKYNQKTSLEDHYAAKHVKKPRYACEFCGKDFFRKQDYCTHRKCKHVKLYAELVEQHGGHQVPVNELYSMDGCTVKPGSIKESQWFGKTDTSAKDSGTAEYECDACGNKYVQKSSLEDHYATQHVKRPRYGCEFCGKPFYRKQDYCAHRKRKHAKEYAELAKKIGNHQVRVNELYSMDGCTVIEISELSEQKIKKKNRTVQCQLCSQKFSGKINRDVHMRIAHPENKTYSCEQCEKQFERKDVLEDHFIVFHVEKPRFECEFCGKQFYRTNEYSTHRTKLHPKEYAELVRLHEGRMVPLNHLYTINGCVVTFIDKPKPLYSGFGTADANLPSPSNETEKNVIHNSDVPPCEICGLISLNQESHVKHLEGHRNDFLCEFCQKRVCGSVKVWHKRWHEQMQSRKPTDHSKFCQICGKKFGRTEALALHQAMTYGLFDETWASNENSNWQFRCDKCHYRFRYKQIVKFHRCDGIDKTIFECKMCEATFDRADHLLQHISEKHEMDPETQQNSKFNCGCGTSFRYKKRFNNHMKSCIGVPKTISEDKPPEKPLTYIGYQIQCTICSRKFPNEVKLKKHLRTVHRTEKKFNCDKCNDKFRLKTDLECHYSIKHLVKPRFECEFCGKQFYRGTTYSKHRQTEHPTEYAELATKHGNRPIPFNELYTLNGCILLENERTMILS
ncbi:zinc finger protein 845-like [Uranotaenia lowii]|uniref:zinc finger protein 845-like n=1 Tax=Uranotaenia lowii TaxID=190385 RepID=UPI0024792F89|nr:zinc finger protein 845-like [Uranotaenia lowii]